MEQKIRQIYFLLWEIWDPYTEGASPISSYTGVIYGCPTAGTEAWRTATNDGTLATAMSNQLPFVSDPGGSCVLPESIRLWEAKC